jgi:hypothetical protein
MARNKGQTTTVSGLALARRMASQLTGACFVGTAENSVPAAFHPWHAVAATAAVLGAKETQGVLSSPQTRHNHRFPTSVLVESRHQTPKVLAREALRKFPA